MLPTHLLFGSFLLYVNVAAEQHIAATCSGYDDDSMVKDLRVKCNAVGDTASNPITKRYIKKDFEACVDTCASDSNCAAVHFKMTGTGDNCFHYSKYPKPVANAGRILAYKPKVCQGLIDGSTSGGFKIQCDTVSDGTTNPITQRLIKSGLHDCLQSCRESASCQAVHYKEQGTGDNCFHYAKTSPLVANPGRIFAYKTVDNSPPGPPVPSGHPIPSPSPPSEASGKLPEGAPPAEPTCSCYVTEYE